MASLVGNSAAHIALLPESDYARKEATTYTTDAAEIAAGRTWNTDEIAELRTRALSRAKSEIKKRIPRYGFPKENFDRFVGYAQEYIDRFIIENVEPGQE